MDDVLRPAVSGSNDDNAEVCQVCLMTPGRVEKIEGEEQSLRTALVDFGGIVRHVNLLYLPEAGVGDYVLVHAGFATEVISEEDAMEAMRIRAGMAPRDASAVEGMESCSSQDRGGSG